MNKKYDVVTASKTSPKIKSHNFDVARNNLKKFSEIQNKNYELSKVETSGGLFGWFDHRVTGEELNSSLSAIQRLFQDVNRNIINITREFGVVYDALHSLDKDILAEFGSAFNNIDKNITDLEKTNRELKNAQDNLQVTNKNIEEAQRDLINITDKQEKTLKILSKFKERLDNYEYLSDVDNIWRDTNLLKEKVQNLIVELKNLDYKVAELNFQINELNKKIQKNTDKIENIENFRRKLERQNNLFKIDEIYKNVRGNGNKIKDLEGFKSKLEKQHRLHEIDNIAEKGDSNTNRIETLENFQKELEKQVHLYEIDTLWENEEENSKLIAENKNTMEMEFVEVNLKIAKLEDRLSAKTKQLYIVIGILIVLVIYILFVLGRR